MMNKNNYGWICPKCGRVHAPFIMECSNCNNNEIKPDPCIITQPWSQDYSKYKSEVTTDTYKCEQNVTTTNGYFPELDEFNTNLDRSIHKYSSQEQLQESLDELNKELENLGVQPTNLDELNNIKNTLKRDSNDDMWPTEQEVNAHLKYIKDQTESEKNNLELKDIKTVMEDIHRKSEEGYESLELDTTYMLEHWICSRCGKIHLVFPEGGCECGAPLEYLTYVI